MISNTSTPALASPVAQPPWCAAGAGGVVESLPPASSPGGAAVTYS